MSRFLVKFERVLFWGAVLLFIFIPLYPKFPLFSVKGTFAAIRLEDILIALELAGWGAYLVLSKKLTDFFRDRLNQLLLLFFGVGLLGVFSGVYLSHTITLQLALFNWLRRVELMLLLPVMVTVIHKQKQVKMFINLLIAITLVVCFYAIGQQFFHFPVVSTTNSEFAKGQIVYLTPAGRVNSTFAGHYDLAVYLMMVLTILIATFFSYRLKGMIVSAGTLAFSAFVLVLTAARFSFFGAVFGVVMSLWLTGKRKLILLILLLTIGALVYPSQLRDRFLATITVNLEGKEQTFKGTSAEQARSQLNIPTLSLVVASDSASKSAIASGSATPSSTVASDIASGEPVDSTDLGVYRSFEIRLQVEWPRAIRAWLQNPFLGSGYSALGLATDNDLLRSLGETGLLGTWALILIFVEVWRRLWIIYRQGNRFFRSFAAGILAMTIAVVANGIFIDVFEASKVATMYWMLIGITLALQQDLYNE